MAEREKYYIGLNGQIFEVSKELYETYYKGQRKEKYFTYDLKQEHTRVDKETGEMIVVPSREDSYERLLEAEKQFAEEAEDVDSGTSVHFLFLVLQSHIRETENTICRSTDGVTSVNIGNDTYSGALHHNGSANDRFIGVIHNYS